MSHVASVDVFGPSHWSYLARVVRAKILSAIQDTGITNNSLIPPGVLIDTYTLFRFISEGLDLARNAKKPHEVENFLASMHEYANAISYLEVLLPNSSYEKKQYEMERYVFFISRITQPRNFSDDEIVIAIHIAQFLWHLAEAGDAETYESRLGSRSRYDGPDDE